MKKIFLIISREYITRVRKKSFIIMSFLGPLLIAAFYGIIFWSATSVVEQKRIAVIDESGIMDESVMELNTVHLIVTKKALEEGKKGVWEDEFDGTLYIPEMDFEKPEDITLFSVQGIGGVVLADISRAVNGKLRKVRLEKAGISREVLAKIDHKIQVKTTNMSPDGEEKDSSTEAATIVGLVSSFVIYIFIFMYSAQVMRGVAEEKGNRIVEVILSSVKPFQLMMGKVIGVGGVGLTQLLIWVVLGTLVSSVLSGMTDMAGMLENVNDSSMTMQTNIEANPEMMDSVMASLSTLNFPLLIFAFFFYFLFGYLMYASLFASIGAAVDNETDAQQFVLPVTLPLILAIAFTSAIMSDPNGKIAIWLSMIPLTSPVAMIIRLPFIDFGWELMLSMTLLVISFVFSTWIAGKVYRIGILLYGKKPSYKELGKWLFMKA